MRRGPIVGAKVFCAVMDAACWQCQCEGECGRTHTRGGMCRKEHSHRVRLLAATGPKAGGALRAWCPGCLTHANEQAARARQDAAAEAQQSLFDL